MMNYTVLISAAAAAELTEAFAYIHIIRHGFSARFSQRKA